MAKFYQGFFLKLGGWQVIGVKTSQGEDPEEARVRKLGKKGGARGFRAADLADVPTPPSLLLGESAPDIIPNTFPDGKGWHPLLIYKGAAKTIGGSR